MTDRPTQIEESWIALATQRPVVIRALKYALVIGFLLIVINHGDAILRGDVGAVRAFKMALTVVVPYLVSTSSSVEAIRRMYADEQDRGHDR